MSFEIRFEWNEERPDKNGLKIGETKSNDKGSEWKIDHKN